MTNPKPKDLSQMTPQEQADFLFGPATDASLPSTPGPAQKQMSPEEIDRLFGPLPPGAVTTAPVPSMTPDEQLDAELAAYFAKQAPAQPQQPGIMSRIGSDIAAGAVELPSAIAGGARNAVQETMRFAVDVGNTVGGGMDKIVTAFGGAPGKDISAPELPAFAKPKSVTGGLASSVSQFVTGLIGVGKITKPIEVASGLARAGRAAKIGVESAKAATVGATAFDPYGPRLADIVESVPGLSNPVSRYLQSDPTDTKAEGRMKNALESLGMDAVLIGSFAAGLKLFKATRELQAGKITPAQHQAVVVEAEAAGAGARAPIAVETPEAIPAPSAANPEGAAALSPQVPPAAPVPVQRDVLDLGSPAPRSPDGTPRSPDAGPVDPLPAAPDPTPPPVSPFGSAATPEQTAAVLRSLEADADALARYGSRREAADAGHVFGAGERIPWQKMVLADDVAGGSDGLAAFTARLADTFEKELDAAKGGSVLSDAKVDAMVRARSLLWGEDQALVAGTIARAGENAKTLAVDLQTGFILANRAMSDTYSLASRIRMGDLAEWGGDREAASAALRDMLGISQALLGSAQSMRAGAGRAMRIMRSEFAPSPEVLAKWGALNPDDLAEAIVKTQGDARALRRLGNETFLDKLLDAAQFVYVNNLLWSPRTHAVNIISNSYLMVARPAERMIGAAAMRLVGSDTSIGREAAKQYAFIGASLMDSFKAAAQAWRAGDSILVPHGTENFRSQFTAAKVQFKAPDSLANVLHNALLVPFMKVAGTPTRLLGTMDEAVKQIVYRAKVQARAAVEAEERGLSGSEMAEHIAKRLDESFDDAGRATDLTAKQEALVSTFSQDLLPETLGKTIQDGLTKHPIGRFALPFLRTPLNAVRLGIKMTPALNLVQAEYRAMISGKLGPEAQAQAIGQMTMGSLYLAVGAYMAASGRLTGGGPSDPKAKAALRATGWEPYSYVWLNANGSRTYFNLGRLDPIAMPFGVVADIVDAIAASDGDDNLADRINEASVAALLGITKQLTQKSYLQGASDFIEALAEPDGNAERAMGQVAANFVPMASALRFVNPDATLKEARDITDRLMAAAPGLSEKVPAKRDAFGDPLLVNKGLWRHGDLSLVDAEIRRMAHEHDVALGPPSPSISGVDLRDVTLKDGRNAYSAYQDLSARPSKTAKPIKEVVASIMKSRAYQRAPDGDAGTRGTKLWMVARPMAKYRDMALRRIKADPNVREAMAEKSDAVRDHYKAQASAQPDRRDRQMQQLRQLGESFGIKVEPN